MPDALLETDTAHASGVDLARSDDVDRLRVSVLRLARRIRLGATGTVTPSQLFVLGSVIRHGSLTIGRIAEIEHVQPPSASKIVSALERDGLVERSVDPTDRRCTHITPTEAGVATLERVRAAGRTWISDRLGRLDPADVAAIEHALPALERLLQLDADPDDDPRAAAGASADGGAGS